MSLGNSPNIIRNRGRAMSAWFHGYKVERKSHLLIQGAGIPPVLVPCTPYDEHFIFEKPPELEGKLLGSVYYCTCGSVAEVAGYGTPDNVFVCTLHSNTGFHQTSLVNLKDWEKEASAAADGQIIIASKRGKKWV